MGSIWWKSTFFVIFDPKFSSKNCHFGDFDQNDSKFVGKYYFWRWSWILGLFSPDRTESEVIDEILQKVPENRVVSTFEHWANGPGMRPKPCTSFRSPGCAHSKNDQSSSQVVIKWSIGDHEWSRWLFFCRWKVNIHRSRQFFVCDKFALWSDSYPFRLKKVIYSNIDIFQSLTQQRAPVGTHMVRKLRTSSFNIYWHLRHGTSRSSDTAPLVGERPFFAHI